MSLYHHSSRDYDEAASDAAARARDRMEGMIERGTGRAKALIGNIVEATPQDFVVATGALGFGFDPEDGLRVSFDSHNLGLHRHARNQTVTRTGILTAKVADSMVNAGPWGQQLLVDSLNRIYGNIDRERVLVRATGGEVRALLSDRYRRMDSGPILEAFAGACGAVGAVPVESHATDTKWAIKCMLPMVFEPVPNEVLAYGIVLSNSDYGDGALSVRAFMLRLWCTNYAIRDECLRKVHLGGRLSEDVQFSDRTHRLDTETMASAVKDIVGDTLSPDRVKRDMLLIEAANEDGINAAEAIEALRKKNLLSKSEAAAVVEVYNTPDVEALPPGNTSWRLSNALSLFAQDVGSGDEGRRLEIEQVAGRILDRFKPEAAN